VSLKTSSPKQELAIVKMTNEINALHTSTTRKNVVRHFKNTLSERTTRQGIPLKTVVQQDSRNFKSSQHNFGGSSGKKMAIWFIALLQRTAVMKLAILHKTSSRRLGKLEQFF